ncbi:Membrane-associated phospholipid phosphatase [Halapricum desulfuricans]|uniref:Membrane-associated phospholipid phosphatase n=1 Tax=Halapricum desulfuricans TaxID=2841257 RepID=A0A897NBN7_9EURY|nr:phosphatase PAP2 family protein [Halapricum desulfuricans]QSG08409.1 Membrane-associated phospholipid phosphatase [Halapricum desulfuricans]
MGFRLVTAVIGALLYTLFIAYGPRIRLSGRVDGLLYDWFPQTQQLTGAVSANTNVFPSLHTSLSVVVLLFAWRRRHVQPRWFGIAFVVTTGIVTSTMVLDIHWLTDVVAGVALAYGSVVAASRTVPVVDMLWEQTVAERLPSLTT